MIRHHGPISGIAAFGGSHVATAGYDNQLILWDASDGKPLARATHDHLANQVSFSPDGRYVLSSSSDYTARLWTVPDLKLTAVFSDQGDDVEMSVFHPSRELVATASRDCLVRVYDFTGTLLARFTGHTADVISVEWLGDSDELLSSSDDGTVKRWSLTAGGLVGEIDMAGVETDTIAITREGVVFAGNDDGEIIRIEGETTRTFPAHEAGIKRLVYHGDSGALVSLSYDRTVRIWNTAGGLTLTSSSNFPAEIWARSCAFLDDRTLVFATFGSTYATYDIERDAWDLSGIEGTGCVNAVTTVDGRRLTIGDAGVLHEDGRPVAEVGSLCNFVVKAGGLVLSGGQLGRVFDAETGEVLHQHRSPLNCAAVFEKDGLPHVVVGAYTGEGLVFSVGPDRTLRHVTTLQLAAGAVKGVAAGGGTIFAVCAGASANWFSIDTFEPTARIEEAHDKIANGCAALPDGAFTSVSRDLKLRIWEADGGVRVVDTPHDHSIKCVAASTDGRWIASGSYSGLVAVYVRPSTSTDVIGCEPGGAVK
ncbi:WD40 repeat domain-containing protein, partial [Streptomyces sp. NPDC049577]|uniref:WD40 repeat domain-containing protein n=1 Tax=Streptomyces sp. NPDC049577 TaxID=3155153 RepID=UPI0034261E16